MSRIGIDCRLWGVKHAGIGRYTKNLVEELAKIDKQNEYVLFCHNSDKDLLPSFSKGKKVITDVKHYSLKEQIVLPKIFAKEKLDLLHVPHFNVPLWYKGKFIVTIHDVLWHDTKGFKVTTLSPLIYGIKYLAYRKVVSSAVHKAVKIIVPSNFVRDDLVKRFSLPSGKVARIYEGVAKTLQFRNARAFDYCKKYNIQKPYLLYVGSLYPHKNLEVVVKAVKQINGKVNLVIVGSRNVFTDRLGKIIKKEKAESIVNLVGFVPDEELSIIYKEAEAFVFPTLSEGFGLPGLEAIAAGCPVICSDIPVLHEVYGNVVLYFNPKEIEDIKGKIEEIIGNKELREKLTALGKKQASRYSWRKMAIQTLDVYRGIIPHESGIGI